MSNQALITGFICKEGFDAMTRLKATFDAGIYDHLDPKFVEGVSHVLEVFQNAIEEACNHIVEKP